MRCPQTHSSAAGAKQCTIRGRESHERRRRGGKHLIPARRERERVSGDLLAAATQQSPAYQRWSTARRESSPGRRRRLLRRASPAPTERVQRLGRCAARAAKYRTASHSSPRRAAESASRCRHVVLSPSLVLLRACLVRAESHQAVCSRVAAALFDCGSRGASRAPGVRSRRRER